MKVDAHAQFVDKLVSKIKANGLKSCSSGYNPEMQEYLVSATNSIIIEIPLLFGNLYKCYFYYFPYSDKFDITTKDGMSKLVKELNKHDGKYCCVHEENHRDEIEIDETDNQHELITRIGDRAFGLVLEEGMNNEASVATILNSCITSSSSHPSPTEH